MRRVTGHLFGEGIPCRLVPITVEFLPRLRLTLSSNIGLGFGWLTLWIHLWLWGTRLDPSYCRQIEVFPRIMLYADNKFGGVHLQWLRARCHFWLWRRP
jgi:hypothetical protein